MTSAERISAAKARYKEASERGAIEVRDFLNAHNREWEEATGCVIWIGATDKDGLPSKQVVRMQNGEVIRHRPMRILTEWQNFELRGELLPEGVQVGSSCRNPLCCSAGHAAVVTAAEREEKARLRRNKWLAENDPDCVAELAWEDG